ncbi:MAG: hypothetical protein N3E38_01215 [Candidatus Aenigmarchaeota archaeon]|nr:hypothetical protein [Candidatus Aenigmarchaeota archaeon]
MSTKAQIFSSDFVFAVFIFLLTISIIYYLWVVKLHYIKEEREFEKMSYHAQIASNVWMREGFPKYWNISNIIDLGLQNDKRFNKTKMQMLNEIGYEKVKTLCALDEYELLLRVYDTENKTLFEFGKLEEAKNVVKIKRVGLLESNIVFIDTIVWSK